MMNKKNKKAITVGIFICLGLAIFIVAIFTLGGEKKTFSKKFPVKATFADISGLSVGFEGENTVVRLLVNTGNVIFIISVFLLERHRP